MTKDNNIRFFDMFAGIGEFRIGLERAGGYTCIGHCEIDKYADRSYRAIHHLKESEVYYKDATKIDPSTMPEFDLLCAGFPCQSFSIAGKRQGFHDPRGTMFFEIARVARERKPAYLLLENVPGLLSHDEGRTLAAIYSTLHELGYHVEWQVLNSKDFGVPQSRRRLFIVGYLDERCAGKILPIRDTNEKALKLLIGGRRNSRVYDPDGLSNTLLARSGGHGGKSGLFAVGDIDAAHAVMTPERDSVRQHGRRIKDADEPMFTLTSQDRHGVLTKCGRIRRLTPRESFRLQGLEEEQIDKILTVTSDAQAYKQAGNAVTANVVHALGLRLKAAHKTNQYAPNGAPQYQIKDRREEKTHHAA